MEEKLVQERYEKFNSAHTDTHIFTRNIDGETGYFFNAKCTELLETISSEEFPHIEIFENNFGDVEWYARVVGVYSTDCVRLYFTNQDTANPDYPKCTRPYKIKFLYPRFVFKSQHFALKRMKETQAYLALIQNPKYKSTPSVNEKFE